MDDEANYKAWAVHLPRDVDPKRLDLLAQGSLPAAWSKRWAEHPEANSLFEADRGWLSGEQLEAASRRAAGRLRAAGLSPGDRMLFSADSSMDLVIAHVAALRAGIVVVPANTAYRERELSHIVQDSQPKAALVDDPERGGWVRQAASDDVIIVDAQVDLPDGPAGDLDLAGSADPALIGYTSGTTGPPKGAVLSHGNLLSGSEAVGLAWRWSSSDCLVLALPLFHVHGLCVGLHGTLLAGASAVLLPGFSVEAVLNAARQHGGTLFFGVPTMYHRMVESPRVSELRQLRLCVSGSAPLPAELHEKLTARADQAVLERYGMTETLMNVSNPYDGERRPGSVGLPLPGVQMRLASGSSGEILLRGPNVFNGYWRQPQATSESFGGDWFRTGDIGQLDPDGYLRILGRSKELIISGGYNVYPREVEDVLLSHPDVGEAAVVGTPSDEWGEVVTAFIVPRAGPPAEEELRRFLSDRLAAYKRPRSFRFVQSLPRNAMGKILKHDLPSS